MSWAGRKYLTTGNDAAQSRGNGSKVHLYGPFD
jgi:hypothetical protein